MARPAKADPMVPPRLGQAMIPQRKIEMTTIMQTTKLGLLLGLTCIFHTPAACERCTRAGARADKRIANEFPQGAEGDS